jgi:hypothetical protein
MAAGAGQSGGGFGGGSGGGFSGGGGGGGGSIEWKSGDWECIACGAIRFLCPTLMDALCIYFYESFI